MPLPNQMDDVHTLFSLFFQDERLRPYAEALSQKMLHGHVCLAGDFLKEYDRKVLAQITSYVTVDPTGTKPFVLQGDKLYLHRYFRYETMILASIKRMLDYSNDRFAERQQALLGLKDIIRQLEQKPEAGNTVQTDWQLVSALSVFLNQFTIITGGPGTGKTTSVAKVLYLLYLQNPKLRVSLAAPTGKAAMRMSESLKNTPIAIPDSIRDQFASIKPTTIHRLLGYQRGSIHFKYNQQNPLHHDIVIVDEASMIDVALFAKLTDAIGPDTRLVLLGDKNQLASVEAGSLFGDLCKVQPTANRFDEARLQYLNRFFQHTQNQLGPSCINQSPLQNHIIELQKSRRFTADSGIGKLAGHILHQQSNQVEPFFQEGVFGDAWIDTAVSSAVFKKQALLFADYLAEPDVQEALVKLQAFRVLCAVREGDQGMYTANKTIEAILHRADLRNHDGSLFSPVGEWYENRPIMVTKNDPELELYNGDTGIIRWDPTDQIWKAWFSNPQGGVRFVLPTYITGLETVYAMTIHKSQGSEYDHVLVLLPEETENELLTAELLYTAITRAKQKVVLQVTPQTLEKAIHTRVRRISGIIERLNDNC